MWKGQRRRWLVLNHHLQLLAVLLLFRLPTHLLITLPTSLLTPFPDATISTSVSPPSLQALPTSLQVLPVVRVHALHMLQVSYTWILLRDLFRSDQEKLSPHLEPVPSLFTAPSNLQLEKFIGERPKSTMLTSTSNLGKSWLTSRDPYHNFDSEEGLFNDSGTFFKEVDMSVLGNGEFEMTIASLNNSYVKNGYLFITPILTSDSIGENAIIDGFVYNITGCMFNITQGQTYTLHSWANAFTNAFKLHVTLCSVFHGAFTNASDYRVS